VRHLRLPAQRLPESSEQRDERVRNYFAQLSANATAGPLGWDVALCWPSDPSVYVDPKLLDGLAWWRRSFGPTSVETIPTTFSQRDGFLLSIEDSWTLYSWSRWLVSLGAFQPNVTVLHIDDHNDLMSPRILVQKDGWTDAITNSPMSLLDPPSVASAITSGAIGIGSFVAPVLHLLPRVDFRHLWANGAGKAGLDPSHLHAVTVADDLLAPGTQRLATVQRPGIPSPREHRYHATNDVDVWLRDLEDGPILLHVDMDYFNNRYNGDSAWTETHDRHDPSADHVLRRIDEVFTAMQRSGVLGRVVDSVVALSPGFFPAELWPAATDRVAYYLTGRIT
jgi:hypothetical protein